MEVGLSPCKAEDQAQQFDGEVVDSGGMGYPSINVNSGCSSEQRNSHGGYGVPYHVDKKGVAIEYGAHHKGHGRRIYRKESYASAAAGSPEDQRGATQQCSGCRTGRTLSNNPQPRRTSRDIVDKRSRRQNPEQRHDGVSDTVLLTYLGQQIGFRCDCPPVTTQLKLPPSCPVSGIHGKGVSHSKRSQWQVLFLAKCFRGQSRRVGSTVDPS